jgi:hypothetical protein
VSSAILPSNVPEEANPPERQRQSVAPGSDAYSDFVVAAGVLALVVTDVVVLVGPRLGSPAPTLTLWKILGPLLMLPLAILFLLLLAPGGVLQGGVVGWRPRLALSLCGLCVFVATLLIQNLPTLLAGR